MIFLQNSSIIMELQLILRVLKLYGLIIKGSILKQPKTLLKKTKSQETIILSSSILTWFYRPPAQLPSI
jgi:hypothetical protein